MRWPTPRRVAGGGRIMLYYPWRPAKQKQFPGRISPCWVSISMLGCGPRSHCWGFPMRKNQNSISNEDVHSVPVPVQLSIVSYHPPSSPVQSKSSQAQQQQQDTMMTMSDNGIIVFNTQQILATTPLLLSILLLISLNIITRIILFLSSSGAECCKLVSSWCAAQETIIIVITITIVVLLVVSRQECGDKSWIDTSLWSWCNEYNNNIIGRRRNLNAL